MADFTWTRRVNADQSWTAGTYLLASVPQGATLYRVRFAWGFYGFTSQTANIMSQLTDTQVFGLVTTVGDGSESVPNPMSDPGNADPPTQRWLWWEGRQPQIMAYSDSADAVWYRDTPLGEPTDMQAMVSAKSIGAGEFVNVWASWAPFYDWDASGNAELWFYASCGYRAS